MEYPFKFNECLLTDHILDILGFGDNNAGAGDWTERKMWFSDGMVKVNVHDQKEDRDDGYGLGEPIYQPEHFDSELMGNPLYFLHDLYEYVKQKCHHGVYEFEEKCKENNLYPYIESYKNYMNYE